MTTMSRKRTACLLRLMHETLRDIDVPTGITFCVTARIAKFLINGIDVFAEAAAPEVHPDKSFSLGRIGVIDRAIGV